MNRQKIKATTFRRGKKLLFLCSEHTDSTSLTDETLSQAPLIVTPLDPSPSSFEVPHFFLTFMIGGDHFPLV